jgi:hypothetical protein
LERVGLLFRRAIVNRSRAHLTPPWKRGVALLYEEVHTPSDFQMVMLSFIDKEVGTMSGLQLLTEKYVNRLKELEAQVEDVKHKLEIVMEASRLLEEEGLSEDAPHFGEKKTFL